MEQVAGCNHELPNYQISRIKMSATASRPFFAPIVELSHKQPSLKQWNLPKLLIIKSLQTVDSPVFNILWYNDLSEYFD